MAHEIFEISFEENYPSVKIKEGIPLSEALTIQNSPILFGCRIGICGTCAIEVLETDRTQVRTTDESEYLEAMCPDSPSTRLACQIRMCSNLKVRKTKI